MKNLLSREAAVKIAGESLVALADETNCEATSLATDGTEWDGMDVYVAEADDGRHSVRVVYLQNSEETKDLPLDYMAWDVDGYEVEEL